MSRHCSKSVSVDMEVAQFCESLPRGEISSLVNCLLKEYIHRKKRMSEEDLFMREAELKEGIEELFKQHKKIGEDLAALDEKTRVLALNTKEGHYGSN